MFAEGYYYITRERKPQRRLWVVQELRKVFSDIIESNLSLADGSFVLGEQPYDDADYCQPGGQ
jgi:hypothetical protein